MNSTTAPNAHLINYDPSQAAPMVNTATIPLIGKGQPQSFNNQQMMERILNQ